MRKLFTLLLLAFLATSVYSQFVSYGFDQSVGTYTEITGGISLGSESSDDQRFVDPATPAGGTVLTGPGFPIGFDFVYNGITFDRMAINTNGWISLGQSSLTPSVDNASTSAYTPLNSTAVNTPAVLRNRIAAFGRDLQAQAGATLRIETIGTAPNRVCVVQWKNYKRWGTTYAGDVINVQLRLHETSNMVQVVFGSMAVVATSTNTVQVGLGGTDATQFVNRASTTDWNSTTAGTTNTAAITLNNLVTLPVNGLTFTFGPMAPLAAQYSSPANGSVGMPTNVSLN